MLTENEIKANKERFIELIKSIDREGVDEFIDYLESTDFFYAPASTRFHGSFDGGLIEHTLKVYDLLVDLVKTTEFNALDDTIKICALCHDLAKINTYEKTFSNKKVYSSTGTKHDAGGNYEWEAVETYKTIDLADRFIAGNHEETSAFIARQFLPLSIEEDVAIAHHHGGLGHDTLSKEAIGDIYNKYPMTVLLHTADLIAANLFV